MTPRGHAGAGPAGANSGTVQSSGAVPQITFVNSGTFTANLGGGNDALVVNGSLDADTIAVSGVGGGDQRAPGGQLQRVEALTVNGNAGSDTLQRDAVGDGVDVHRRRRPDRRAAGRPAQHHCRAALESPSTPGRRPTKAVSWLAPISR